MAYVQGDTRFLTSICSGERHRLGRLDGGIGIGSNVDLRATGIKLWTKTSRERRVQADELVTNEITSGRERCWQFHGDRLAGSWRE